jgi:organic radical activating enzyme
MSNKTDINYRKEILDKLSPSFCGAKWYNATIWLGSGMTTSCHHPPAHRVDLAKVTQNPKLLHNTPQKKQDRAKMIAGERPAGCEYCWKIEDMGRDAVSDRVYKSRIYKTEDLHLAKVTPITEDVNLKTLEIAFDRTCNFACSYCNPAFSSTWVRDIKQNGPYQHLISDGRNHFTHPHDSAQLYKLEETNPYVEAFFKWWDSDLHKTLDELRITGGEPMMSPHLWRLLDWFETEKHRVNPNMRFAINSNLVPKAELFQKFIEKCRNIPNLHIYTSNESVNEQSNYIRDGMNYTDWFVNLVNVVNQLPNLQGLHNMCTINALCLESLPEFLDKIVDQKIRCKPVYKTNINFTLNILRFPSFQSPLVLSDELRTEFKNDLDTWLKRQMDNIEPMEVAHVQRLIDYLDVVKTPHSESFDLPKLRADFKNFYKQYDERRNKDLVKTFPKIGEWYNGL